MSVASLNVVPEDLKTSIIHVTSYDDKNMRGIFYNPYYGEEIAFSNLARLLFLMEDMMDEINSPQASTQSRRFGEIPKPAERESMRQDWLRKPNQEAIATFKVKVLFRQGASWQGKLAWIERKKEMSFRSALEMIKLMDSALPQPETVEHPQDTTTEHVG